MTVAPITGFKDSTQHGHHCIMRPIPLFPYFFEIPLKRDCCCLHLRNAISNAFILLDWRRDISSLPCLNFDYPLGQGLAEKGVLLVYSGEECVPRPSYTEQLFLKGDLGI